MIKTETNPTLTERVTSVVVTYLITFRRHLLLIIPVTGCLVLINFLICLQYIILFHFIHQWHYSSLSGPGIFFSFVIFLTQTVGLVERVISPSQGHYLHAGQHKHGINAHTNIYALSGIRTHDPRVRASEDSSCPRPRGNCDRHSI
jgi:hypothetical protein